MLNAHQREPHEAAQDAEAQSPPQSTLGTSGFVGRTINQLRASFRSARPFVGFDLGALKGLAEGADSEDPKVHVAKTELGALEKVNEALRHATLLATFRVASGLGVEPGFARDAAVEIRRLQQRVREIEVSEERSELYIKVALGVLSELESPDIGSVTRSRVAQLMQQHLKEQSALGTGVTNL